MFLLYTDETNMDPRAADFFVYGGIAIDCSIADRLSRRIDEIRIENGYLQEDILKFNTAERPDNIEPDVHRETKRQIIEEASNFGVKLFCSFILHNIAESPEAARIYEINRVCYHFDCFLREHNSSGLVLIDRFDERTLSRILKEKFSVGLRGLPFSDPLRLENVLGFHMAVIGSSHFSSLVDIIMGSMRFAVNALDQEIQKEVSQTLLQQLSSMCIETSEGTVSNLSVFFSPREVKVSEYRDYYRALSRHLEENGLGILNDPYP